MIPQTYKSSDFAGIDGAKVRVYYGYDQIDPVTEEWCGVVWKNNKEVARYTNSQLLEVAPDDSPCGMIIATLALYLNK